MQLRAELAIDMDEEAILDALNGDTVPVAWKKEPEVYIADITKEMRKDVDDWIESGRKADGSESPYWRDDIKAERAWEAARSHVGHWAKPELRHGRDKLPQVSLLPKYSPLTGVIETKERCGQIIAAVLLGDLALRIAKCRYRNCGRYFSLDRPRTKPYTKGLFCCTEHNRAESAMRGMETRRRGATERMLETAARELLKIPKAKDCSAEKERLVEKVNQYIAKDNKRTCQKIEVNWVTFHWQEILDKAKELSHA